MEPKVGVIIVSYNSRPYLDDLFLSLQKVKYPMWEIVFIDNASSDDGVDYLKEKYAFAFPNLTIIKVDKNLGFAGGNNVGFKYLAEKNFDFAYLLNQDTTVESDFLETALRRAGDDVGSVQSLIYVHPQTGGKSATGELKINTLGNAIHFLGFGYCYGYNFGKADAEKYIKNWARRDAELNIAYSSGAGVLFNMKALAKTGFFDDGYFMYHEDLDLGWRLRLAGYKNVLAPESVIYHKYEFSKSIKKYYWMERNRYITIFKNYSAVTLALIAPALVAMEAGLLFFSFFSGWWREKLRVYDYLLRPENWKKIIFARKNAQALRGANGRQTEDGKILKYFVGKILFQDMDSPVLKYIANPIFNLYFSLLKLFV